jgi:hypothetical protein
MQNKMEFENKVIKEEMKAENKAIKGEMEKQFNEIKELLKAIHKP